MESTRIRKKNDMLQELARASDIIRRKHRMIKKEKDTSKQAINEMFKPMITPLHELVNSSKQQQRLIKQEVKMEPGSMKPEKTEDFVETENVAYDVDRDDYDAYKSAIEDSFAANAAIGDDNGTSVAAMDDANDVSQDGALSLASTSTPIPKKEVKTAHYLNMFASTKQRKNLDEKYGVRKLVRGMKVGDSDIEFSGDLIHIGDKSYENTPGLLELLFKKSPDPAIVNKSDRQNYIKIVKKTNVCRKYYKPERSPHEDREKSAKYRDYIAPYMNPSAKRVGQGLPTHKIAQGQRMDYVYWDDPNELVDRLRLLMASQAAGNTSHTNEISSIIEELREARIIY